MVNEPSDARWERRNARENSDIAAEICACCNAATARRIPYSLTPTEN
jgi:hypothetical protein